jgi:hypothetical protein
LGGSLQGGAEGEGGEREVEILLEKTEEEKAEEKKEPVYMLYILLSKVVWVLFICYIFCYQKWCELNVDVEWCELNCFELVVSS